ncbi:hypothetical protein C8Q74DRAFT_1233580 [Fomes fomentarius]|nr:hypothetical protein C8Q74DRAFT_1233580 [Fomes fomentarius]
MWSRARRGSRLEGTRTWIGQLRHSGIQRHIVQDNHLRDENVRYSPRRMNEEGLDEVYHVFTLALAPAV